MSDATLSVADAVRGSLAGLDVEAVRRSYWDQNEFVYLERWLPAELIDRMLAEVRAACVRPSIATTFRATRRAAA